MKKAIVLVLALAMIAALVSGCAAPAQPAASAAPADEQQATKAPEAANAPESAAPEQKSDEQPADKKLKIGLVNPDLTDKWMGYLYEALQNEAANAGCEYILTDAKNDTATQIADIENLISQGVDAIILDVVDTNAVSAQLQLCKDAGIVCVGICREFTGADAYIGSDSYTAGTMETEAIAKMMDYKGKVGMLMGIMGTDDQTKRTQATRDVLAKYPDMEIVLEDSAEWFRDKAMKVVETWIQTDTKFDCIIANNDEMAIGAIQALRASNMAGDIKVAGIDATLDALVYVESGELQVTIFQDPYAQAKAAMEVTLGLLNGKPQEAVTYVDYQVVTKDNFQTFVDIWNSAS